MKPHVRIARAFLEFSPRRIEKPRLGALKRKDRLLFIADGEERTRRAGASLAAREFTRQRVENSPLLIGCVLRLVDKNVIDA